MGNTYQYPVTTIEATATTLFFRRNINELLSSTTTGGGTEATTTEPALKIQEFIRPGHLIKIDDEIMFVYGLGVSTNHESHYDSSIIAYVERGVMGTTAAEHTGGVDTSINIISPKFKFPSGSKGKNLKIKLLRQYGHVDGIGITYKGKKVK